MRGDKYCILFVGCGFVLFRWTLNRILRIKCLPKSPEDISELEEDKTEN